ncbi:hypothetical protein H5410_052097 [Solanum commersonii]|uniref:Uncharacterized protein n=1 Tax=Solanum commersonii TaxID=4109 RepID=A0A9J5X2N2_SOLCO|nr:hypothetical protein H5410_052097 [Solanum commersonii]
MCNCNILYLVLSFFLVLSSFSLRYNAVQSDMGCLKSIKKSLADPLNSLASWNFDNQIVGIVCIIMGVSCWNDNENRVLRIDLPNMGLIDDSFNFSVPPLEESLSTPVYGVREIDKSISLAADIFVSPVLHSENMLVCSPTLVLSSDKSPNSEARSVAKHNEGLFTKETNIGSLEVSSTISERVFEEDLHEGEGPESCVLTAGAELYELESPDQVPPRSEPIFDQTPKSFDVGSDKEEEEEEIPLKWLSRGMRGANQSQVNVSELEAVKGASEVDIVEKSAEREKEQQRKGNGKLVLSHSKGDKRKYVTRSETQKVMGNAIAASKAHTERARKRIREGLKPKQPASTPLSIDNSEIESEEAVKYVAKKRRKNEEERIKSKGNQTGGKKSPTKNVKVKK